MSEQNVEVVRAMFAAWNAGDMDALRDVYDSDVIARPAEGWPEPGPFVGRESVMHVYEQLREAWDADTLEAISVIDAGDRVVVRHLWRGVGQGPEMNMEVTNVFTVRKGKIVYQESFWDHAEALEALELSEHGTTADAVEVVRRAWAVTTEASDAGDDPIARLFEQGIFAPGCRFIPPQEVPDGKPFVGQEEISAWYRTWTQEFVGYQFLPEEIVEAGSGRVVAVVRQTARGRESGASVELRAGFLYTFEAGQIVEVVNYFDPAEAFEAAGLSK